MKTLDQPVFILCVHRSGSTLLKNMLNAHPSLAMLTEEPDLDNPWQRTTISRAIGKLNVSRGGEPLERFLDGLYSGEYHGTFWRKQELERLGIPRSRLKQELDPAPANPGEVLRVVLQIFRQLEGKPRAGAKFPVHFSKYQQLLDWFPDARLIFLIRDPRAVLASKLAHPATIRRKSKGGKIGAPLVHYGTLLLFLADYLWLVRTASQAVSNEAVLTVKYEDLLLSPTHSLQRICTHCRLGHVNGYLTKATGVAGHFSSHSGRTEGGLLLNRLSKWKGRISGVDRAIIEQLSLPFVGGIYPGFPNVSYSGRQLAGDGIDVEH